MLGRKEKTHEQVSQLLPWFVNDSLSGRAREKVISHLQDCASCRGNRDRQQRLMALMQDDPYIPDHRQSLARLVRRIDIAEREKEVLEDVATNPGWSFKNFSWTSSPMLSMAAMVLVAVGLVSLPVLLEPPATQAENYRTLTSTRGNPGEVSRRVLIGFAQDSTGELVRKVLVTVNATIVSNPDESGRYLIDLRIPPDRNIDEFIASIGAMQGVRNIAMLEVGEPANE